MAKMGKSMSMASRLAAATALTGTLAACDGRFGKATDVLFAPLSSDDAMQAEQVMAPAAPGNPVYIGGSQAANDALYQQTYGAPLEGSGQAIPTQQTYSGSFYRDDSITAAPITNIPGGPVIDAGTPVQAAPVISAQPIMVQPQFSAPIPQYSDPVSAPATQTFPSLGTQPVGVQPIGTEPIFLPQSALPQSAVTAPMFSDASALDGVRDIEPLLGAMPEADGPYGSSASHRYSVAEEPMPMMVQALPDYTPQQYSMPIEMIDNAPFNSGFVTADPAPIETVEVAALGGSYMPMPRSRPAQIGPVFEAPVAAVADVPVPQARPMLSTPMPSRRPVQMAALSGQAITDAPPLTAAPEMIEVEPVFLDETPVAEAYDAEKAIETAALAPMDEPEAPISDAPKLTAIKREDIKEEMASVEMSKTEDSKSVDVAALDETAAPKVEIAEDIGDLKELSGTSWRLSSLNGEDVPATAELHFDGTSGFAGGQGICNNYGGEFTETLKGEFDMGNIFSTETDCENRALEKQYIVALESANRYRMAPGLGELMLLDENGKTIARFSAF